MESGEATFGRYLLTGLIGQGGMGQVFRAYDTETDRVVALKVLPPQLATDEVFKERFRREANAAARLNDPHVVPIHGFGEIDHKLYVDMRLIEGRDLGAILRTETAGLEQWRAVEIICQTASALNAVHRAGMVHRDVKPSNILVTEADFAYLIAFGVVLATKEVLTATSLAVGTVAYMAPEQFTTGTVDARSDVYALTCVLFESLTGHPPFPGNVGQQAAAHSITPPPRPSLEKPGLARELDAVIARGMAKNPGDRYQSMVELAEAARAAVTPAPPRSDAVTAIIPRRPHRRMPHYGPPVLQVPPVLHVPPTQPRAQPQSRRPPWWRRRATMIVAVAVGILVLVNVVLLVVSNSSSSTDARPSIGSTSKSTSSSRTTAPRTSIPVPSGRQTTLPFGNKLLVSIAVDADETVYVGSVTQFYRLTSGADEATGFSFAGKPDGESIAVLPDGTFYFLDFDGSIHMVEPGSTTAKTLPFKPLSSLSQIAVARDGTVYATDVEEGEVLKLTPGANAAVALPVTGLLGPTSLAIDADDNLFVLAGGDVAKIAKGATTFEVVPGAPKLVGGLAADEAGNVYLTDILANKVRRRSPGAGDWTELPFRGLVKPGAIAVDSSGDVYVVDDLDRVVKLAAN